MTRWVPGVLRLAVVCSPFWLNTDFIEGQTTALNDTTRMPSMSPSPNVSLPDPIYQTFNSLSGLGLLDAYYSSDKPLTYDQTRALINRARVAAQKYPGDNVLRMSLDDQAARYDGLVSADTFPVRFRSLDVQYMWFRQPPRPMPLTNAVLTPFLSNRAGRNYDQGHNLSFEGTFDVRPVSFALMSGRVRWHAGKHSGRAGDPEIRHLYLKMRMRAIEMQVGRDNLTWGHGFSGGLGLSHNADPFDFIKISNWKSFQLPWVFRYIGPIKTTGFLARLDADRHIPNPKLFSLRVDMAPKKWLDIGLFRWMILGGDGATNTGFSEFLADLFFYRPGASFVNHSKINNAGGLDIRFRIPYANGMHVYSNIYWEDTSRLARDGLFSFLHFPFLPQRFNRDTASMIGFSMPGILAGERLGVQVEHVRSSLVVYRHGIYTSGYTFKKRLLGHDLGPSGQGGYVRIASRINRSLQIRLDSAVEYRSDEITITDALNLLRSDPGHARAEWRYRLLPGFIWHMPSGQRLTGQLGYERVNHFNFRRGVHQHNGLLDLSMQMYF